MYNYSHIALLLQLYTDTA